MDDSTGDNGVTNDEREVLGRLTGKSAGDDSASRRSARPDQPNRAGSVEPPRSGPLTAAELQVRRRVLDESGRIAREDLPAMFPERGRQLSRIDEQPARVRVAPHETTLTKIGKFAIDLLGAPARRLGPGVVRALGLAGVVLLMALLVVIMVRLLSAG